MIELMQMVIRENTPLLFTVALLFSAISGQMLKVEQRVSLVYTFCLLMSFFDAVSFYVNGLSSLIVLFLIFEVFSSDTGLVHLYSFKYKVFNFLFRVSVEFYGLFFYVALAIAAFVPCKEWIITQSLFVIEYLPLLIPPVIAN